MRFFLRSAAISTSLLALALPLGAIAQGVIAPPQSFAIGQPASDEDIERVSITAMPDGRGLPPGSGTVGAGEAVYNRECASCHGARGIGGSSAALAGVDFFSPDTLAADKSKKRTIGNYWPYATTVFDYIRRAMPYDRPGSLATDEVYAVTAYLLYLNKLAEPDAVIDARKLPAIVMPARQFFRRDRRSTAGKP